MCSPCYATYQYQNHKKPSALPFSYRSTYVFSVIYLGQYNKTVFIICYTELSVLWFFSLFFILRHCCSTFTAIDHICSYPNTIISLLIKNNSQFLYIPVNTCTVPTVTDATPVKVSSVDYNSNVTYTCADGYSHTAGDLTRSCNADGSLTGTTPVCTSKLQW